MIDLLDVNIWIALSSEDHSGKQAARYYWQNQAQPQLAFCRTTALGMTRVLCQLSSGGPRPMLPAESWNSYLKWRQDPQVIFLEDPDGLELQFEDYLKLGIVTPRVWIDAYLAAFAVAGNYRLVTFDKDFERFPGLNLLRL